MNIIIEERITDGYEALSDLPFFIDRELGFYYSQLSPDRNNEIIKIKIVSEKRVKIKLNRIIGCNTSEFEGDGGWNMKWYRSESNKTSPNGKILSGSDPKSIIIDYANHMAKTGYDYDFPSDQIKLVRIIYILDGRHHLAYYVENGRHRIASAKLSQLSVVECNVTIEIEINIDKEKKEKFFGGKSSTEYKLLQNLGSELLDALRVADDQPS